MLKSLNNLTLSSKTIHFIQDLRLTNLLLQFSNHFFFFPLNSKSQDFNELKLYCDKYSLNIFRFSSGNFIPSKVLGVKFVLISSNSLNSLFQHFSYILDNFSFIPYLLVSNKMILRENSIEFLQDSYLKKNLFFGNLLNMLNNFLVFYFFIKRFIYLFIINILSLIFLLKRILFKLKFYL